MALKAGEQAPDATVFKYPREAVRLSELRGRKHVLLFFPLAFSSTCTEEMCTMAEDYSAYRDLGVEVIGLSVDSPYVNQKFADSCQASFPILSDFNKQASEAYGVLRPALGDLQGVSERAAFVVDEQGVVRYAWVGEHPGVMPDFAAIKAAL
ncbi:MAG TPA: redoxin domain-containing protein [Longimicrobiales bacterium]